MDDKKLKDISTEAYLDVLHKRDWDASRRNRVISEFLNAPNKNIFCSGKTYGGFYYRNIIVVSFEDFLRTNNYRVVEQLDVDATEYSFLSKENIEISPNVFKSCMIDGLLFLECHDKHFVLEFQRGYDSHESWYMYVYYDKANEPIAKDLLNGIEVYAKEHSYLRGAKIDASLSHITLGSSYSWNDIVLPAHVKRELVLNVDNLIENVDVYKKNNVTFKRGIILKGVPGVGKTMVGKVLCNSVNCTFIWVTPRHLELSHHVKFICDLTRELSPAILFLEDLDLYGEERRSVGNASLLGELMNQLDGLVENNYVIVIATTNRVENVEGALRNRPGRFDRIIDVPLPSATGRLKMLEVFTKSLKLEGVDLKEIAKLCDKYTGSHVKELVSTAILTAIDEKSIDTDGLVVLKPEFFIQNVDKVRNKIIEPAIGFSTNKNDDDCFDLKDL